MSTSAIDVMEDIISVANGGDVPSGFRTEIELIGKKKFFVICTRLVESVDGWMEQELGRSEIDEDDRDEGLPVLLDPSFTWCKDLSVVLSESTPIAKVFEINSSTLDFQSNLAKEVRKQIGEVVERNYRPVLHWTPKHG